MAREFSEYTNIFFWDFKRMDNVNYNFQVLSSLFQAKNKNNLRLLNKPIIIICSSIIECMLYDFLRRIKQHKNEKIPGIDVESIDDTRKKFCDKFSIIITHFKKHDYLRASKQNALYNDLDFLCKLRNRVHIQDMKRGLDKDEDTIWIEVNVELAIKTLERVCEILSQSYPRPGRDLLTMDDFPRPWVVS